MNLAKEKGSYSAFKGSDWQTGAYFEKRGYLEENSDLDWAALCEEVSEFGIRNAYLLAVAKCINCLNCRKHSKY